MAKSIETPDDSKIVDEKNVQQKVDVVSNNGSTTSLGSNNFDQTHRNLKVRRIPVLIESLDS